MTEWAQRPLIVHGEPDDHLRLSVLLADWAALGQTPEGLNARALCRSPKTAWPQRLEALNSAMNARHRDARGPAVLAHPDGLVWRTSSAGLWSDLRFERERKQLADHVAQWAARGTLRLLRLAPDPEVSELLTVAEALQALVEVPHQFRSTRPLAIAPDLVPLALALVQDGSVTEDGLDELLELEDPELLVEIAYDRQPEPVRATLRRIAGVRPAYLANGSLGPWQWGPDGVGQISRETCAQLRQYGWLVEWFGGFRMPQLARRFLWTRGGHVDPAQQAEVHLALAAVETTDAEDRVERHHHLVAAGEWERAVAADPFYVTDLRQLAYRLSVEQREWGEAAKVYERIVSDFDDQDAYAWHYLGYNLDRSGQGPQRARDAYARAARLDPHNPLYAGRLMAIELRQGEDIATRFAAELSRTHELNTRGVSYLAKPVLRAVSELPTGPRKEALEKVREQWRGVLARNEALGRYL